MMACDLLLVPTTNACVCYAPSMQIRSATFVKGIVGPDEVLADGRPQVAFVGRSNVGKSSTINALTRQKGLAQSSSTPGHTKKVNVFLINQSFYLLDLPGYGFTAKSKGEGNRQQDIIGWYLFQSAYKPRLVVMLIDAHVGATASDVEMLESLERRLHPVLIVANKIDRVKPSVLQKQLRALRTSAGSRDILMLSAEKNTGVGELGEKIQDALRGSGG